MKTTNKRCDLHSHSRFSDGTLSPAELVRLAEERGISALALTDHNTCKGLPDFMEAGRQSSVNKNEIHIVGLFFRRKNWSEIDSFLEQAHIAKELSNQRLIDNLNKAGYMISEEDISALTSGTYNRAHVARALMAKGYVNSVAEAFDTLLEPGKGFYYPPARITSVEAIHFIKTFGATAIMAHGLISLTREQMRSFLPEAKKAGLDAKKRVLTQSRRDTVITMRK